MNNAEWMVQNGYKFSELRWSITQPGIIHFYLNDKNVGNVSSLSVFEAFKTWLDAEHREQILDDAEKSYLSAVIKPFRNEKLEIVKHSTCNGSEEWLNFVSEKGSFYLPNFKTGTMYKGMEPEKHYTLEELGL